LTIVHPQPIPGEVEESDWVTPMFPMPILWL
jgi:hypothetical protein